MNYVELSAAIRAYCENDFPQAVGAGGLTSAEQVARFVQQAEERIFNSVQFPSLRKNVTGTTTTNNKYLSAPSDFLAVYSLAVIDSTGRYEFILNKDVNFIRESYPDPTDTGKPQYYAIFGPTTIEATPQPLITNELSFILGPTPDTQYGMELHYYYYPVSIAVAGTSWLGDNFDTVLLYGAMLEAATFMKSDPDVMANYTARYTEALSLAKRLGDGMERTDAYRSGQARYPVK
jgi:hypothetical protein